MLTVGVLAVSYSYLIFLISVLYQLDSLVFTFLVRVVSVYMILSPTFWH